MEIVSIQELTKGDKVVLQTGKDEVSIFKVDEVDLQGSSIVLESGIDVLILHTSNIFVLNDDF